jgi:exonuclease III
MAHKVETSKVITWNANGIRGRKVSQNSQNYLKQTNWKSQNYNILRNDRDGTSRGGGVAILVKNGIPYVRVRLLDTEFECVAIRLVYNNIFVVAIYI